MLSFYKQSTKNIACLATAIVVLAFLCLTPVVSGADDLSGLVDNKWPDAKEIIKDHTLYRESKFPHLPINAGQAEFLLDHPMVSLALARLYAPFLDLYRMDVKPDGVIHIVDEGALAGDAELLYSRPGRRIYRIAGYFDIFKIRFNGRMLLVVEYAEVPDGGMTSLDGETKTYIKVDSAFAGFFARLMDTLFPAKVDQRIERFTRAANDITLAIHGNPAEAFKKLQDSGDVSAEDLGTYAGIFPTTGKTEEQNREDSSQP